MNRSSLHTLALIHVASAFALGILCLVTVSRTRLLNFQATEVTRFNIKRQALANLLNESVQYSQKMPAINPILISAGLAANAAPVPAPAPGAVAPAGVPPSVAPARKPNR